MKEEFQRLNRLRVLFLPLPSVPPEKEVEKQPGAVQVFVRDVRVTGNTVFSETEIEEVTAPFKNRTLMTEDLERLRLALTLLYINKGYLTSGAIIPDQDVIDGIVDSSNHRREVWRALMSTATAGSAHHTCVIACQSGIANRSYWPLCKNSCNSCNRIAGSNALMRNSDPAINVARAC